MNLYEAASRVAQITEALDSYLDDNAEYTDEQIDDLLTTDPVLYASIRANDFWHDLQRQIRNKREAQKAEAQKAKVTYHYRLADVGRTDMDKPWLFKVYFTKIDGEIASILRISQYLCVQDDTVFFDFYDSFTEEERLAMLYALCRSVSFDDILYLAQRP